MPAKPPKPQTPNAADPAGIAGMGIAMSAGRLAAQAWMDFGAEAVRFAWDRLQQDIKTQQAMLSCTSLDQVRAVQADYMTATQTQYAAEARKLLEMLQQATASGLTVASKARRYDDVPL
ncbi:phasin family protein [Tabrizicola sp. BL-A-41-H6]|uniref:phasin family protein n=1 Tax=Tabrizicola sp. BL-A-41-H6 TaxID=3421107 RepID=UPI003D679DB9